MTNAELIHRTREADIQLARLGHSDSWWAEKARTELVPEFRRLKRECEERGLNWRSYD